MHSPFPNLLRGSLLLALALGAFACAKNSEPPAPNIPASSNEAGATTASSATTAPHAVPADVVRVDVPIVELQGTTPAEASVRLHVAKGFHINANPPTFPYLKATELQVEPTAGITTESPCYPAPMTKKFAFSNNEALAVYENEAEIKLPVRAAADATKGAHELRARVRAQPCDDQACYPPRTIELTVPLVIK